jgi:uncharacterized membrane protein
MTALILGLVIFLGVHSTRLAADEWRSGFIARRGPMAWKGLYSVLSLVGFVLLVWGYGQARQQPVVLWAVPKGAAHLASLLTLVSFVLLAAKEIPGNGIKARVHHPMTLGIKVWAFAHLLANNTLADLVLFGSFLAWSIAVFIAVWLVFAMWAHGWLIGVRPFG